MTGSSSKPAPAGFWAGYWRSLKPLSVEEPIDVWVHRPLAYLLARVLLPTPVSPNAVTLGSIVLGICSGVSFFSSAPHHMQYAGMFLFLSAVFDCADGQLSRMRGTSSQFGRMLDGTADLVVSTAAVSGAIWVLWRHSHEPPWLGALVVAGALATTVTSTFHTVMYDHYKNVFLRMTVPGSHEGEAYENALARYHERPKAGPLAELVWPVYLFYVKSQCDAVHGFDPYSKFASLPPYSEESARVYASRSEPLMRVWRTWFGFGSLVFGISVAAVLDVLELYLLARLVLLNAVFYGYMRPKQRETSAAVLRELGVPSESVRAG